MNSKKTILIACSFFGKAIPDYFKFLGFEFAANGFKVVYIFDGNIKSLPVNNSDFEYYTWPSKRPRQIKDFVFLFKLMKRERPIITISNFGSHNVMSILSFIFNIKRRITYIHTHSTQIKNDFTGGVIQYKFQIARKYFIYKLDTHFLVNSTGTKCDFSNSYQILGEKIFVLPYLIKKSELNYKNFNERDFYLLVVGRLHPSKGHKLLLKLFSKCLLHYPNLKLFIAGDGYLKSELQYQVSQLGLNHRVVFLGNVPYNEINHFFSNCIAAISSSLEEAFGLVNIEALREGTPIICTKSSGIADILEEEINGQSIDLNNENSLLDALKKLINNWEFYSRNALNTFESRYSSENISIHFKTLANFLRL